MSSASFQKSAFNWGTLYLHQTNQTKKKKQTEKEKSSNAFTITFKNFMFTFIYF